MKSGFADTSFFVAFLNPRDVDHAPAVELMKAYEGRIVTTDWVLTELGNFLASRANRTLFVPFVGDLSADPRMEIVAANRELFEAGCALFASRPDKEWSLTDCISMVVMQRQAIAEALTADHHFEQAGFTILMK